MLVDNHKEGLAQNHEMSSHSSAFTRVIPRQEFEFCDSNGCLRFLTQPLQAFPISAGRPYARTHETHIVPGGAARATLEEKDHRALEKQSARHRSCEQKRRDRIKEKSVPDPCQRFQIVLQHWQPRTADLKLASSRRVI